MQTEGSGSANGLRVWPFMLAISVGREVDTTYLLLRVPFMFHHCLIHIIYINDFIYIYLYERFLADKLEAS